MPKGIRKAVEFDYNLLEKRVVNMDIGDVVNFSKTIKILRVYGGYSYLYYNDQGVFVCATYTPTALIHSALRI